MNDKIKKVLNLSTFCIIITVLFIYFLKWIDPRLIDFKQQPIFLFNFEFLNNYLTFPGGFAEYVSLFISQFFHFALLGAFLLILIFYLIVLLTRKLLSIFFPANYVFIFQFLPVLLLVHLHSHYSYSLKPDIIILVSIFLTIVYNNLITKRILFKISFFIIFSAFLILLFGGSSLILFSLLIILLEIKNKKNNFIQIILIYVIISFVLPFLLGSYTPYMNMKKTFFDIFLPEKSYKPYITLYPLFLFYPVFILFGIIYFNKARINKLINNTKRSRIFINTIIQITIPIICLFFTIIFSFNKYDKVLIELNYYAEKEEWQSVLKTAKMLSLENRLVLFQINRALYHTGKLTNDLFSYNQLWGEDGLILTRYYNSKILMPISDLYYDLGYIKESLHWAYEALTKYELNPAVLKRIAISNLILGEYKVSEKFLTILSKSMIHKKWADHYLEYLYNKDLVKSDSIIQEKRDLMPKHDYYANPNEPSIDLYNLLRENPGNKMAFEYYIASSLLKHDIGNVIKNLHYLSELNYSNIPRHIEEAILLYILFKNSKDIDLKPYYISYITTDRFNKYNNILYVEYKNNKNNAQSDLTKYFGNTLWYYLHYVSPITNKRKIKERMVE